MRTCKRGTVSLSKGGPRSLPNGDLEKSGKHIRDVVWERVDIISKNQIQAE